MPPSLRCDQVSSYRGFGTAENPRSDVSLSGSSDGFRGYDSCLLGKARRTNCRVYERTEDSHRTCKPASSPPLSTRI